MPDPTSQHLSVVQVAAAIGRRPDALNSLRKRGRFPAPDGRTGRSPWWQADTVQSWLEARQRPPEAVSSRQAIAQALGLSPAKLDEHPLPPADGTHRGNSWWLPQTLHAWAGEVFAGELLDVDDIRAQLDCSDDEWDQLRDTLPDPALTEPDRWWPRQVTAWIDARGAALRADPDVLFVRDIPATTALAADTIRRYRWEGKLPEPDGTHRGRPWWRRETISRWNRVRNRDHTPVIHRA